MSFEAICMMDYYYFVLHDGKVVRSLCTAALTHFFLFEQKIGCLAHLLKLDVTMAFALIKETIEAACLARNFP